MQETGKMFQFRGGELVEVVRRGDELLPTTDPITQQIIGQLTLELVYERP